MLYGNISKTFAALTTAVSVDKGIILNELYF